MGLNWQCDSEFYKGEIYHGFFGVKTIKFSLYRNLFSQPVLDLHHPACTVATPKKLIAIVSGCIQLIYEFALTENGSK